MHQVVWAVRSALARRRERPAENLQARAELSAHNVTVVCLACAQQGIDL